MHAYSGVVVPEPVDWEMVRHMLSCRSGARDEWTGAPLRPGWTVHHRQPRRMGGTRNPAIHSLANLVAVNGHGTLGSHGWIESHRAEATDRGYLVPMGMDPEVVPIRLWSGRTVWLSPDGPFYLHATWEQ